MHDRRQRQERRQRAHEQSREAKHTTWVSFTDWATKSVGAGHLTGTRHPLRRRTLLANRQHEMGRGKFINSKLDEMPEPSANQSVVVVLGTPGGNLLQVADASGRSFLCRA